MTIYKAGDLVLVQFPFSSLKTSKKRPALVLNQVPFHSKLSLLNLALITSKIEVAKIKGDLELSDWEAEGLLHPSLVRLSKIATIENQLVQKSLGTLTAADMKTVSKTFKDLFKGIL